MHFSQGRYQPQLHIAQELLNFPDENLTVKQIQQFLGIINYIRDFIPKLAKYTSPLSQLLRKNPPPWGTKQTEAVKALKKIAQTPPALKIPGDGKRILQTDASDHYWGAVLIEEINGVKHYCGHASGQFKEAEKHYHTTYKEALAVKLGIQKFDFHLRGYHFEVQMDNSSFPRILEFKNKMPPDPQTLRLKDWFSRYDFTTVLEWYSPLEWWRNQLGSALNEAKERRLTSGAISKLKTVFMLHRPYQTDPRTKFLICGSYADLWETIEDYPPNIKVTKELMDYVNLINFHDKGKTQINTTCISHGNLPPQWQPVDPQVIGEKKPMEVESSKNSDGEDPEDPTWYSQQSSKNFDGEDPEDIWYSQQFERYRSGEYFSEEYLSDQNMSPSHEPIFKH
ncbi:hypothetical protein P8452_21263 [Trifolium repens]|nr:hypothetical protein P8452_21263 [Trifolium repens]